MNTNKLTIINGTVTACDTDAKEIIIPDGVTAVGDGAFRGCKALISVTCPDSVTSVGKWAFFGCENLENINIPQSITRIGHDAFKACPKLIDEKGFLIMDGILLSYSGEACEAVIPDGVKAIKRNAFFGCTSLKAVTIPEGVNEIADGAFTACGALEKIIIPDSVQVFGDEVFVDCGALEEIRCPDRLNEIIEASKAGYVMKLKKAMQGE